MAVTIAAAMPRRRSSPFSNRLRAAAPYFFIAPFFILFIAFLIVPLLFALDLSIYKDTLVGGRRLVYAQNYAKVFADPKFWDGVLLLGRFALMQIPVMLGIALVLALILDSGMVWAKSFFRVAFFIPYAVPAVIAALIWGYLYGPSFGPFTQLADAFGLPRPDFLGPSTILASIANVATWEYTGYNMIIYFAALQAISPDLEEAAAISGVNAWKYAIHVKLPLIYPSIFVTVVFSIIGSLQLFNEPYLFRSLNPSIIDTHYTPNIYAYNLAFTDQQYNYSAAVSFVLGGVVAVISYVFMLLAGRKRGQR